MERLDFGNKLIEVRKIQGLTQEEVAEKCKISTRTIQRIESGIVKPRSSTIKIISETLGFDFFETSNTENSVNTEYQTSKLNPHTFLWYLKDLFNLKTNAMKKISILSTTVLFIVFLCISLVNVKAQSGSLKDYKSLVIQLNEDNSIKRVEAAFTHDLTLDSLVHIKKELQEIGIIIHYKKIEFDVHNLLTNLACEVICNDGFSGSFEASNFNIRSPEHPYGFYRDYADNTKGPFGTGGFVRTPNNKRE